MSVPGLINMFRLACIITHLQKDNSCLPYLLVLIITYITYLPSQARCPLQEYKNPSFNNKCTKQSPVTTVHVCCVGTWVCVCARVMCMQTRNLINSLAFASASASASVRYGDRDGVRGTSCLNKPTNRQRTHTKLFSLKKLAVAENISLWWSNKSFPRCISAAIFECNFSSNCEI